MPRGAKVRDAPRCDGRFEKQVSALELARRDAIMNSQLHSFTGMFFGKDPTEVTEGELHSFLRIFVFFPAIFASLAATALALASVTPLRKTPEAPVEVDDHRRWSSICSGPLTSRRWTTTRATPPTRRSPRRWSAQHIEPKAPDMAAGPMTPEPEVRRPMRRRPRSRLPPPRSRSQWGRCGRRWSPRYQSAGSLLIHADRRAPRPTGRWPAPSTTASWRPMRIDPRRQGVGRSGSAAVGRDGDC